MSIQLYSLSGSPFGWKVQLALEHLGVAHVVTMLSPDRGDTRQPSFLAMNPHGKLPVIVDDAVVLYESDVVVEYLEDAYGRSGSSLWPARHVDRAMARLTAAEASTYLYPPVRVLVTRWLAAPEADLDRSSLDETKRTIGLQLEILASRLSNGFVASDRPGAADFAAYPLVALLKRLDSSRPGEALTRLVPPDLLTWAQRLEALPYFERTQPPHWRSSP